MDEVKPFKIESNLISEAWSRVRANKGSAGIDNVDIEKYESNLQKNLYKLWNRMSSGTYFPKPVKLVEIPKANGGKRPLGIPTVEDRTAQMAAVLAIEPILEAIFHNDSYAYRHNRSAHDAIGKAKERSFGYGDRIEGSYAGEGRDESLTYTVDGNGYTDADGTGVLTDGVDTLRHVTRLHMHDEYTLDYGQRQELQHLAEDRYLWYCAGYRYPVQETWQLSLREDSALMPIDSTAYLYLPVMQLADLSNDPENAQILAALAAADDSIQVSMSSGPFSPISAILSPDGTSLTLTYELDAASPLRILACDILGSLLGYAHYDARPAGTWQENIALSRRPVGGIVVVNVECGAQSLMMKVTSTE